MAGLQPLYMYAPNYISGNTFALILTMDIVVLLIPQYTVLASILPGHRNWIEVAGVFFGCIVISAFFNP